jgi:hypothetical protein
MEDFTGIGVDMKANYFIMDYLFSTPTYLQS